MTDRISSLDKGYVSGDLSLFPEALDDADSLYIATNNAQTTLSQGLAFSGSQVIVSDTSLFPPTGLIRIALQSGKAENFEIIYYASKTATTFTNLIRGFSGSVRDKWPSGSVVTGGVFADAHNSLKDAAIKIESTLGTTINPTATSLNGILTQLEVEYLSPKPTFRGFPLVGPPPLTVTFQNFTSQNVIRYLWDFGDGGQSFDRNPIHTYTSEGVYTVSLTIIVEDGGQGIANKMNYVTVSTNGRLPFFYVSQVNPTVPAYSVATATALNPTHNPNGAQPAQFLFVDQTEGSVIRRLWVFGDGNILNVDNPNVHTTMYTYQNPGTYDPSELVEFSTQSPKRVFLQEELVIL